MRAKKSYGQHFLTNEAITRRIADSLIRTDEYERVVEIGPGQGMLTKYLLERDYELFAVEADWDMVEYLWANYPALTDNLIKANFLKVKLEEYVGDGQFGLIGNFPYNISSQILFRLLEYRAQIPEMVGMFQREVAERVTAPPGNKTYGVISVLVQAYYAPTYLFTVKAGNFNPPPKVQSAVIHLSRREDYELGCDPKLFKQVVKQAFLQRRKMLRNTMKSFLSGNPILQNPFFEQRPERLGVAEFVRVTNWVAEHRAAQTDLS